MDLAQCTKMLENCIKFLENYRKDGFKQAMIGARELADELQIEPIFKPLKRVRRVKRHFDENTQDEPIEPRKKLEVEFYNPLLDKAISSIKERFEQLNSYSKSWNFLFCLDKLPNRTELLKSCTELQNKLTVENSADINGTLLCDELISIRAFLNDKLDKEKITPLVLNFIKKHTLQGLYPNVWIALRILLTIPVTVASGERSFSKLKLIKTYLRSTMLQDRLTSLGTISIENEILKS